MRDPQAQDAHAAALNAIEKALKRAGARVGYTMPVLSTTPLGNAIIRHDAPQTPFKEYHEQDAIDALAVVRSRLVVLEQERDKARKALRCDHPEQRWEHIEHKGDLWGRCRECGYAALYDDTGELVDFDLLGGAA